MDVTGDDGGESDGCGVSGDAGGSRNSTKALSSSSLSAMGMPGARAKCQPSGWNGIRCICVAHEEKLSFRSNRGFVIETNKAKMRNAGGHRERKGGGGQSLNIKPKQSMDQSQTVTKEIPLDSPVNELRGSV